jgi:hypothetical protein
MILQGLYNRILATNNLCTLKKKTLTSFVSKIVKRHKPLILYSYASVNGAHLRATGDCASIGKNYKYKWMFLLGFI